MRKLQFGSINDVRRLCWLCVHFTCFRIVVYHVYFIHIYNDVLDTIVHIQRIPENRKLPYPASV